MGRVAYLFPGQGSQQVGMGLGFAGAHARSQAVFAKADAALGFALSKLIAAGPADRLALTEHTQPAVLVASIAALEAAREAGLPEPDFVAGHSLGEWTALVATGAMSLEDAVTTVRARGRFMQEAVPAGVGAMSAVLKLAPHLVETACAEIRAERPGEWVGASTFNGPDQTVIAGHAQAVAAAQERCKALGAKRVIPLGVSAPFHTPLMAPVTPRLAEVLASVTLSDSRVPIVSNADARPETDARKLQALLLEQVTAPVRWTQLVATLADEGVDVFIELGPGAALTGMVRRQLPSASAFAISNPEQLEAALASLAA